MHKDVIFLFEHTADKYAPKVVKKVRLAHHFVAEAAIEGLFGNLASKPKQLDVLMKYLQRVPVYQNEHANHNGIEKSGPHQQPAPVGFGSEHAHQKRRAGAVRRHCVALSAGRRAATAKLPLHADGGPDHGPRRNHDALCRAKDIVLLHGVTGAGKTEIYIDLIRKALEGGGQVLYLLPEIALTAQIVTRLMRVFGSRLGVYHSKFSDNERVEVWNGVLSGRFQVVVGVRSAVFLPFDNLSLIIVDEEHESSTSSTTRPRATTPAKWP
jgi:primosomal protein N' (replication factor Y)